MSMKVAIAKQVRRSKVGNLAYLMLRDCNSYLQLRRKGSFAQHGEDEFLERHFAGQSSGRYIDIGCSHPFRISNTYKLYRKGWSGIAVDPIPAMGTLFRLWRPRDRFLNVGIADKEGSLEYFEMLPMVLSTFNESVAKELVTNGQAHIAKRYKVDVITPNTLFATYAATGPVDFLSIDVESLDLSILKALDFSKYRPRLIAVEFNTEEDRTALVSHLHAMQYNIIETIGCNLMAADTLQTRR
jgi:FkbM family methyltransferase